MPLVTILMATLAATLPWQVARTPDRSPEFNGTKHMKGIVSMAHGDDPASASTSFFIVTADASTLDGKYTVFGRKIDGLDVLDTIESAPVSGESPTTRIDLLEVRVVG